MTIEEKAVQVLSNLVHYPKSRTPFYADDVKTIAACIRDRAVEQPSQGLAEFPWDKVWVYCYAGEWGFTVDKNTLPDGALACEYIVNSNPFKVKVERKVVEMDWKPEERIWNGHERSDT